MLSCIKQPQTTPNETESGEKQVAVIDPTHFLFGRSFVLRGITTRSYLGTCCVIEWEGTEYFVPIAATDQSPEPVQHYPTILNVAAIDQLVTTYKDRGQNKIGI